MLFEAGQCKHLPSGKDWQVSTTTTRQTYKVIKYGPRCMCRFKTFKRAVLSS